MRDARLPADLAVGDILATPVTGAYGHSMASNYNKVRRPPVLFVRNGQVRTVVRYTRGGATPGRPTSGSAVPLSDPHARAARLTGLAAGATYAVAIWTRDRAGHYSSAAATRFTTPRTDPVPTGTVQGTVTDAAAHPLAGVAVWAASGAFGDETRAATTGAGGHYSFAAPSACTRLSTLSSTPFTNAGDLSVLNSLASSTASFTAIFGAVRPEVIS